jgi:hypothetical protein
MVKIINHGLKPLIRRIGTGQNVMFPPGEEVEVKDAVLIETLKSKKIPGDLQIKDSVGKENVGGGIRTRSRPSKRLSRPNKSKKHLGKSKQTSKKEVSLKSKLQKKVDRALKKPKGLTKSKRAD